MGLVWIPRPSPIVELISDNKLNEKQTSWDTRAQSKGKEGWGRGAKREDTHPIATAHRGVVFWAVDQREAGWEVSPEGTVGAEARRKLASMPGLR